MEFLSQDEDGGGVGDGVSYADASGAAGLGCVLGKRRGQYRGKGTVVGADGTGLSGNDPDGKEEEEVYGVQRNIRDLHGHWSE